MQSSGDHRHVHLPTQGRDDAPRPLPLTGGQGETNEIRSGFLDPLQDVLLGQPHLQSQHLTVMAVLPQVRGDVSGSDGCQGPRAFRVDLEEDQLHPPPPPFAVTTSIAGQRPTAGIGGLEGKAAGEEITASGVLVGQGDVGGQRHIPHTGPIISQGALHFAEQAVRQAGQGHSDDVFGRALHRRGKVLHARREDHPAPGRRSPDLPGSPWYCPTAGRRKAPLGRSSGPALGR